MATITVINPTTATATKVPFNTDSYREDVAFHASGLAGAETITPYVGGSAGWTGLYDEAGEQILLTATKPQMRVAPGAHYAFDKGATAGAAALDASVGG